MITYIVVMLFVIIFFIFAALVGVILENNKIIKLSVKAVGLGLLINLILGITGGLWLCAGIAFFGLTLIIWLLWNNELD